ncbi:hypothetical protein [Brevundimonas sp.]
MEIEALLDGTWQYSLRYFYDNCGVPHDGSDSIMQTALASAEPNALARGFYTVPEAARYIESGSATRIRGWLNGYRQSGVSPLIDRDYQPIDNRQELSFLDLIEVRFVEYFRQHGVSVRALRSAGAEARRLFDSPRPFASSDITFKTDGKSVFVEHALKPAAKKTEDHKLWQLVTKQYELYEVMERSLINGVGFNPKSHLAETWKPRPDTFPKVIINPRLAYGHPVIESKLPTSALYDAWLAEGQDLDEVAYWFDVKSNVVDQAVRFEQSIRSAEHRAAA